MMSEVVLRLGAQRLMLLKIAIFSLAPAVHSHSFYLHFHDVISIEQSDLFPP